MGEHKGRGFDAKKRRLADELACFFLNELNDDRLVGCEFTGCDLSADLRHLTVFYLLPERAGEEAERAISGVQGVDEDRAFEVLQRRPEARFKYDRGAANQRRVGEILEELRGEGQLPPKEGGSTTRD